MNKELDDFEKSKTAQAVEGNLNGDEPVEYEHLDSILEQANEDEQAEQDGFESVDDEQEEFTADAAEATAGMALSAIQGTVSLVTGVDVEYSEKQYEKFAKDMTPFLLKHGDKIPGLFAKYHAEIIAAKALGLVVFATIGQIKKAKAQAKADAENPDSDLNKDKQAA